MNSNLPKMPESTKLAHQPKAILKEARSLLSSVTLTEPTKPHVLAFEKDSAVTSSGGREALNASSSGGSLFLQCVRLMLEFHRLSLTDFQFEFKDWTMVKAVFELLVRWGIYPYLSPGVGIPLQKRFGEKAIAAAASALSDNLLHDASTFRAAGSVSSDSTDRNFETHPLVLSAQLLSSILLERPVRKTDGNSSGITGDQDTLEVEKDERRIIEEEDDPGFSSPVMALPQLVLSHHLVDILAALLQAAHGSSLTGNSLQASEIWKNSAKNIDALVESLPAPHLVETLFILLGEAEGLNPPLWFKPEVGKLLSLAVMRDGGVAAVMERLVGSAEKGSVHVYARVATQLARVPRSVASKDHYYKGVCMQLQPLLVLPQSHSRFGSSSGIASGLISNMHETAILLACFLAHQDPKLVEEHLTRPIVEPLLSSGVFQSKKDVVENKATERVLVDSLMKVQALIRAGHKGSVQLRQQLLLQIFPIAPELMLLNYLLWPSYAKDEVQELEGKPTEASNAEGRKKGGKIKGISKEDFPKGFLINKRLSSSSSAGGDLVGPFGQFVNAVSDIVHAQLSQSTSEAIFIVSAFLFPLDTSFLEWPTADGEISDALKAGREQSDSPAVFLTKLLVRSESWELALALLGAMMKNVLKLRRTAQRSEISGFSSSNADVVTPETVLRSLQTLGTFFGEIGLKAVEQDPSGALPVLEEMLALVEYDDLLADREMLDLLLPLLHCAVRRIQRNFEGNEERIQVLKEGQKDQLLRRLEVSLRKVQQSGKEVSAKQKQFAGEIGSMICELLVYR